MARERLGDRVADGVRDVLPEVSEGGGDGGLDLRHHLLGEAALEIPREPLVDRVTTSATT